MFKLLIVKMDKTVKMITQTVVRIEKDKWHLIKLMVMKDKLWIWFDNILRLDSVLIDGLNTSKGT